MRKMKKLIGILLAVVMTLALTCTAFAGSITIDNSMKDNTYYAYKILDATSDGAGNVAYTIKEDSPWYTLINENGTEYFIVAETADSDGNYAVTQVEGADPDKLIEWLTNYISVDPTTGIAKINEQTYEADGTTTGTGATAIIDNLAPGYYFVSTNTGTVVSIDTAAADVTVIDKNPTIDIQKNIVTEEGNVHDDVDGMGEDVNFDVTANVPKIEGDNFVVDYTLEDSLSNGLQIELTEDQFRYDETADKYYLTDDMINDWITLYDGEGNEYTFTDYVYNYSFELLGYDVYTDDTTGDTVHTFSGFILTYYTFNIDTYLENGGDEQTYEETKAYFDNSKYPVNTSIEIKYSAHVTSLEGYENTNVITLDHKVTPWATPKPEEPSDGQTQTSTDYVYSWELDLLKINGDGTRTPLEGAIFTLESADMKNVAVGHSYLYVSLNSFDVNGNVTSEGNTYNINDFESTYYVWDEDTQSYVVLDVKDVVGDVDQANTYVRILTDKETEAAEATTHSVEGTSDASGHIYFEGLGTGTFTLTEIVAPDGYNLLKNPITFTISWNEGDGFTIAYAQGSTGTTSFTDGYVLALDIENNAGSILPGTGGMGTTIFYIIGIILIAGAAVLLISRRRMHSAQ